VGVIVLLWLISIQSVWDVQQWGELIPTEIGITTSELFLFFVQISTLFLKWIFEGNRGQRGLRMGLNTKGDGRERTGEK
jgi:hypothetical protein